jgi:hypothetical protein
MACVLDWRDMSEARVEGGILENFQECRDCTKLVDSKVKLLAFKSMLNLFRPGHRLGKTWSEFRVKAYYFKLKVSADWSNVANIQECLVLRNNLLTAESISDLWIELSISIQMLDYDLQGTLESLLDGADVVAGGAAGAATARVS